MMESKKLKVFYVLMFSFLLSLVAFFGFLIPKKASADFTLDGNTFEMDYGAQVLLAKDGLRFVVKMDSNVYDYIVTNDTNEKVSLSVWIAPLSYFEKITDEDYSKLTAKIEVDFTDEEKIYRNGVYYYANAVLANLDTNNNQALTAAQVDYSFVGIGVITDTTSGQASYTFANFNGGDIANNTRTQYDILNAALLDPDHDYTADILDAESPYKNWFGTSAYPVKIDELTEYENLIRKINDGYIFNLSIDVYATFNTADSTVALADGKQLPTMNSVAVEFTFTDTDAIVLTRDNSGINSYQLKYESNVDVSKLTFVSTSPITVQVNEKAIVKISEINPTKTGIATIVAFCNGVQLTSTVDVKVVGTDLSKRLSDDFIMEYDHSDYADYFKAGGEYADIRTSLFRASSNFSAQNLTATYESSYTGTEDGALVVSFTGSANGSAFVLDMINKYTATELQGIAGDLLIRLKTSHKISGKVLSGVSIKASDDFLGDPGSGTTIQTETTDADGWTIVRISNDMVKQWNGYRIGLYISYTDASTPLEVAFDYVKFEKPLIDSLTAPYLMEFNEERYTSYFHSTKDGVAGVSLGPVYGQSFWGQNDLSEKFDADYTGSTNGAVVVAITGNASNHAILALDLLKNYKEDNLTGYITIRYKSSLSLKDIILYKETNDCVTGTTEIADGDWKLLFIPIASLSSWNGQTLGFWFSSDPISTTEPLEIAFDWIKNESLSTQSPYLMQFDNTLYSMFVKAGGEYADIRTSLFRASSNFSAQNLTATYESSYTGTEDGALVVSFTGSANGSAFVLDVPALYNAAEATGDLLIRLKTSHEISGKVLSGVSIKASDDFLGDPGSGTTIQTETTDADGWTIVRISNEMVKQWNGYRIGLYISYTDASTPLEVAFDYVMIEEA